MMRITFPPEWIGLISEPETARPGNIIPLEHDGMIVGAVCENCLTTQKVMIGFRVDSRGTARSCVKWFGSVQLYGHMITVACPVCSGDSRKQFLLDNSGMVGMMIGKKEATDLRMEDFKSLEGKVEARALAVKVLADLTTEKTIRSFTLTGPFGTGKTLLLACIANSARLANIRSKYTTAEAMLQDVRDTFNPDTRKRITEDVIAEYSRIPVLCIDELDRANFDSSWVTTQYFDIVNRRLSSRTLTLLASNRTLDELSSNVDPLPAVASRLKAGLYCVMGGDDLRPLVGARLLDGLDGTP